MRIAVNTRLLLPGKLEGIGWFTFETFRRMAGDHPEHEFLYLFDRSYDPAFITSPNIQAVVAGPQARHPILYYAWFEHVVPRLLRKHKADIFVSPDGYLPLNSRVPSLAVFHDLNFEHYPQDIPWAERWYYRHFFPLYAHKATRLATVSQFSRQDIASTYGIPADRIDVVYNGVNEGFRPLGPEEVQSARDRLSGGRPYFIFIGAQHPRKNLVRLFEAFDQVREQGHDVALLITGGRKWWTRPIDEAYRSMRHSSDVIFTGRMVPSGLQEALGAAAALTYVSYFEGFGIPILEAFRCRVPVITSNLTSMPEIAGEAALLVDPFDTASIARAMVRVLNDPDALSELADKGSLRLRDFSWEQTAGLLWNSIRNCQRSGSSF
ncbi:MAG TPA: glycosyltransferase family 1 protein [Bacteroidales bacterium]|nr:glycosyltransferase family 1 protein [Bacteroidales bacterium]